MAQQQSTDATIEPQEIWASEALIAVSWRSMGCFRQPRLKRCLCSCKDGMQVVIMSVMSRSF